MICFILKNNSILNYINVDNLEKSKGKNKDLKSKLKENKKSVKELNNDIEEEKKKNSELKKNYSDLKESSKKTVTKLEKNIQEKEKTIEKMEEESKNQPIKIDKCGNFNSCLNEYSTLHFLPNNFLIDYI